MPALKKPTQKSISKKFLREPIVFFGQIDGATWRSTRHAAFLAFGELNTEPNAWEANSAEHGKKTFSSFLELMNAKKWVRHDFAPSLDELQGDYLPFTDSRHIRADLVLIAQRVALNLKNSDLTFQIPDEPYAPAIARVVLNGDQAIAYIALLHI